MMGYLDFDSVLIELDDAPEVGEGETYELAFAEGEAIDYTASLGAIMFYAENEDGTALQLVVDTEEPIADGANYELSKTYISYCWLADLEAEVYLAQFKSGEVAVEAIANDLVTLTCTLKVKNGDIYKITVAECAAPGIEFENPISLNATEILRGLATKRLVAGKIIIEHNGTEYTINGTR